MIKLLKKGCLLDDRAGLESAYNNLKSVVDYANSKSCEQGKE